MAAARPGASLDPIERARPGEGKGAMDRVIETLASGLGNSIGWLADHGILFLVFAALWVAFIAALVVSQGSLDQTWAAITSWPWPIQVLAWVLFLPVIGGLWLWETSWPLLVRIVGVLGLAWFNLMVLIPRAARRRPALSCAVPRRRSLSFRGALGYNAPSHRARIGTWRRRRRGLEHPASNGDGGTVRLGPDGQAPSDRPPARVRDAGTARAASSAG